MKYQALFILVFSYARLSVAEKLDYTRCNDQEVSCQASVTVDVGPPQNGRASGVVISGNGLVLTNAHVIGDTRDVSVWISYRQKGKTIKMKAVIVDVDFAKDLALVWAPKKLPSVKVGSLKNISFGNLLKVISTPKGMYNQEETKAMFVDLGIFWSDFDTKLPKMRLIQIEKTITSGSSGGGIFDKNGKLVGLLQRSVAFFLNWYVYAIPADTIREYLASVRMCTPAVNYCVSQ